MDKLEIIYQGISSEDIKTHEDAMQIFGKYCKLEGHGKIIVHGGKSTFITPAEGASIDKLLPQEDATIYLKESTPDKTEIEAENHNFVISYKPTKTL